MTRLTACVLATVACLSSSIARADSLPDRVVAPYVYLPSQTSTTGMIGDRSHYRLAFVIADKAGNPQWDGIGHDLPAEWQAFIKNVRAGGGDCVVSFGGAAGRELAIANKDPDKLFKAYAAVMAREQFTQLDFDIEGDTLAKRDVNHRRNAAIARLQRERPGVTDRPTTRNGREGPTSQGATPATQDEQPGLDRTAVDASSGVPATQRGQPASPRMILAPTRRSIEVTFTLPAGLDGLEPDSIDLLTDAKAQGVHIDCVNAMVMDFGSDAIKHHPLLDCCTIAAEKTHAQLMKIDPALGSTVGLTTLIGVSDNGPRETFTLDDATKLTAWAKQRPWIQLLSFWNASRDRGLEGKADDRRSGVPAPAFAFEKAMMPFLGH